jgi:type II secretory pathway pseudopilin PulG
MTTDEGMTKSETRIRAFLQWSLVIASSLGIRHPSFRLAEAFTILELLAVVTIITLLAGLILATSSYVHEEGARARAETEIAAMSAALESYEADNGAYPASDLQPTEGNPSSYQAYSNLLYLALVGDTNDDGQPGPGKPYMSFKSNQLDGSGSSTFIKDPFGNSYGYSTLGPTDGGYNSTFDLWSTAGDTKGSQAHWIRNW